MYCVRKVTEDLYWVGANDHRLTLFENCFPIPRGVSYNAYCLLDEKTALFDTVDWSACRQFLENLEYVLHGRPLDYLVVNHLEPDHAACIEEVLLRYPEVTIVSNEKAFSDDAAVRLRCRRAYLRGSQGRRYALLRQTYHHLCFRANDSLAGGDGQFRSHGWRPVFG